ncbi:tail fiber assembly protein (plasmid) [Arsenophonus nasoniae]|uniref:Tail fiber assembly protein n=1 Tax=Arsenophonus nasoniae TaxID=638 RepID=A0A4P7KSD4_9GAMM|nr:tail fiber assembly protein [Arsenophonus nasoniae]QBY42556.1 Caudovirales tail fiber assembly protein, lambda gpK [Arsenophonus nasoniae]WGM06662.1 tail fiber assembly protein [Arsenophonus nasoniae]WGM09094.1 tail fiber assembly protein [Arsenophonus nasoniae]WGM11603.1 tail fiber assembly protein [Arsenophonus nasoniae]WGM13700.1 tail fiber assembly protein [Arsenophonus nasoniae]
MNLVNEETYYFGQRELAWFAASMKKDYIEAGSWDDKAKAVPYSVYREFALSEAPLGKMLGSTDDGYPTWIDIPPRPKKELIADAENEKRVLMQGATDVIIPLQDAVDLEMATEDEITQLRNWKLYRLNVYRTDTSNAPDIDWPKKPE